jgi:hypothetical protein
MTAHDLRLVLRGFQFHFATEEALQAGIERALQESNIAFQREVKLNDTDRIDFLIARTGLEVKTKGSDASVVRQLHRYAQVDSIDELLLVTTRARHELLVPATLNKKPVEVMRLIRL